MSLTRKRINDLSRRRMLTNAKQKAARKWLNAALAKKLRGLVAEDLPEEKVRAIVLEIMSEAVPWMQNLLGREFHPRNALEFFRMAIGEDEDSPREQ
jgi:hypothetical protein